MLVAIRLYQGQDRDYKVPSTGEKSGGQSKVFRNLCHLRVYHCSNEGEGKSIIMVNFEGGKLLIRQQAVDLRGSNIY
jgi:hypothetical protein